MPSDLREMALSVLTAFVLSCMSSFALGLLVAGLLPTARTAQIVAMVFFYPTIFISGVTIPREILPERIRQLAQVLPLTHVVGLLRGPLDGRLMEAASWRSGRPVSAIGSMRRCILENLPVGIRARLSTRYSSLLIAHTALVVQR